MFCSAQDADTSELRKVHLLAEVKVPGVDSAI